MDAKKINVKIKKNINPLYYRLGLIILGLFLFVILMVLISKISGGGKIKNFADLEEKMIIASNKYLKDHINEQPSELGDTVKISLDTLVNQNYLKKFDKFQEGKDLCDGHVRVSKIGDNNFAFVPFINCGNTYKTVTLLSKIMEKGIKEKDSKESGLYRFEDSVVRSNKVLGNKAGYSLSSNPLLGGYIYRGENPDNFIKIDKFLYRIIKIDKNNDIIIMPHTLNTMISRASAWDNSYNKYIEKSYGYNKEFKLSTIKLNLDNLLETSIMRIPSINSNIVPKDYCIGSRLENDIGSDLKIECRDVEHMFLGALTISDYMAASLDKSCYRLTDPNCSNYNYLHGLETWTLTSDEASTHMAYLLGYQIRKTRCNVSRHVRPLIALDSNTIYLSGDGTKDNPYVIK